MKSGQERKRELIDLVLDNETGLELREALMREIESDPGLKAEYESTARAVQAVQSGGRMSVPPFFTQQVMARLPRQKPGLRERISGFLFRGRVLRWNMATALAALIISALALGVAVMQKAPVRTAGMEQDGKTVVVTMNLYAPDAGRVSVAGSFNKWRTDINMLRREENGFWTISIPLQPGDYTYMFVVDGRAWVTDPNAETYRDDGFGNKNSVLRVKT